MLFFMVPVGNSIPILEDLVSFWATQQVVAGFLRFCELAMKNCFVGSWRFVCEHQLF